jgi:membrane-associated phospholipid phosphatase
MVRHTLRAGKGMSTSNSAAPRSGWPFVGLAAFFGSVQRLGINLLRWTLVLGRPAQARPPRPGVGALTAVVATVAAIIASMFYLDTAASDWALHLPRWLIDAGDEITNFGLSGWFLYPLGLMLLLLAAVAAPSLPRLTQGVIAALGARFGFLFLAIALPGLFETIIKRLIGRARPYVGAHDDPFAYMPFIWRPEYASMPSGHATTATAAAFAIGAIWPRMRPVMWLYALIIMFTRVIINVHHPSDVVAGALVGIVGASLVRRWFASRRLVFRASDLKPYPWPPFKRIKAMARSVAGGA